MASPLLLASLGSQLSQMAHDTALRFGLDWPHFIAQCLSFSVLAYALHRFAYRPVLRTLEERRRRIAESLANADKIKEELAKSEAARQEILDRANAQGNQLIEEARAAATKLLEQETQKAIATANQIVAKAKEASDAELRRMKAELRGEMGRLVVEAAAKVSGKILTVEDHRRLVEETNRELVA